MSLITLQDGQWLTAELLPIFKVDGSDGPHELRGVMNAPDEGSSLMKRQPPDPCRSWLRNPPAGA